jgi:NADPH-dependent curcumin reductase CurA
MGRDNLSIHLAERPKDEIVPGKTFSKKVTAAPTAADLKDGEILVESLYLALEPSMKVWMSSKSYYRMSDEDEADDGSCSFLHAAGRFGQCDAWIGCLSRPRLAQ